MNPLFENKKDLFYLQNQTLGFASLHIGEKVTVKVPVWQKIDTYSREKVIEGYRIITGIIKKIPKNPTPRSFVEIEVDNKQTVKVTLNNFRKIDNNNCYLFGNETDFVTEVYAELGLGKEHNKRKVLALAKIYGIEDETVIKELYETAVFNYLKVMYTYDDVRNDYYTTVEMYNRQMTLSHRTSNSILLQQYSTPAPIAYLAGAYIRKTTTEHSLFFEPSAGNGLLTLALPELQTIVNEIDKNRYSNLKQFHNFRKISNIDASKPISHENKFDGIVTNPPFGKITTEKISGYNISKLEHIMSIRALDTMKNSGRASIIVGGHTEWDQYGRVQMGSNRIFLSYLYHYYNVEDIINISGSMYSKQGTTFPIRLILINGRKITPNGTAPLKTDKDITVKSFDELWQRMSVYFDKKKRPGNERLRLLEIEMEKEIAIMEMENGLNGISSFKKQYTQTTIPSIKIAEKKDLRIYVRDYYTKNIQGKSVVNKHIGLTIYFGADGKNELSSKGIYAKKAALVQCLPELLENAQYNNWGARKMKDEKTVKGYANFKAKAKINGKMEIVRISVKVKENGKAYYTHEISIKKPQ